MYLSYNPSAIKLILNNQDKIDWVQLSRNPNPLVIKLLEENYEKINWYYLSLNPNAIKILENNQDKIDWYFFSINPAIFQQLDYEKMRINNQDMYEDLIKEVMKPSRVFKNLEYDYLEELFGD
jgi:hypothetical protein